MIIENKVKLVLQLCDFNEDNKDKCAFYTGLKENLEKDEDNIILKEGENGILKQTKKKKWNGLITRKLQISLYKLQDQNINGEANEEQEKEIVS